MIKVLFLGFGLFTASAVFADSIHSHGGGDLLEQVFKAISKILYGDGSDKLGSVFHALIKISLTVGAFCALLLAFFRQRFEPLIRSFLLPGLVIVGFLLIPRTSVEIVDDHDSIKKRKPIEVPFFLGKFAVWTSYSFDRLHDLFKTAIGDIYPWTTNIYAYKNFLRSGSVPLSDLALEENFQEFCRECVFRDLGLGLYTNEELSAAPDLFEFLVTKTSAKRAVAYDGEAISCKDAAAAIIKSVGAKSLEASGRVDLLLDTRQNNAISEQKVAIDFLQKELFRPDLKFHKKGSNGSLGAVTLMSLHIFLEAMLYLIFPLIVLLSLLTFGIRTALLWVRSIVWVYTWPIFYLAADLFLDAIWKFRGGNEILNLANAAQLADLYTTMEWIACGAIASIPFLSWFLIQGGISQLVQVSSALPQKEKTERMVEIGQQQHLHSKNDSQDISRQTHWEVLSRHSEKTSLEDGFKEIVERANREEKVNSLQSSLASIRESVKDSSRNISKAVKEARPTVQNETSANAPSHLANLGEMEQRGHSLMHTPSHGSWSGREIER